MPNTIDEIKTALRLHQAGRLEEAALRYGDVLVQEPEHPIALHLLGLLRLARGDGEGALALLDRAITVRPPDAGLRRALGDACVAAGDLPRAVNEYAASLTLRRDPQVLSGLALTLLRQGQAEEGLQAAREAAERDPDLLEAQIALGAALRANLRPMEAIKVLDRVVTSHPQEARAWLTLGNAEGDLDCHDEAEACLRRAIAADPTLMEARASLGTLLTEAGRLEEAIACAREAVRLSPRSAAAHWALAWPLLLSGDFGNGFAEYEWRKHHDRFARDFAPLAGQPWRGESLAGQSLLVRAEQGFGDAIQFSRYLPDLARMAEQVVLACTPKLMPLLKQLPVRTVAKSHAPECAFWVDQMSLPLLFGTRPDTIPATDGYLRADPQRTAAWRRRAPQDGLRLGVAWAGNPLHDNDRRRSLPPEFLEPLTALPGVELISLQVGQTAARGAALLGITDHAGGLSDFAETAALIATLDLVVTVDTAVAHLAGAMGKPVFVMLAHASDWRWMNGRQDSPWYDSARLFRQPQPGDWMSVVAQIDSAIRAMLGQAAPH